MVTGMTKKGELLSFRATIEEDIQYLNDNLIRDNSDEILRDVAYDCRAKLIEASNIINDYRLRHL